MSFSVLMSVYFRETPERLERCLKSIWDSQSLKPDRIIIVEDGPLTDSLYSVLNHWEDRLNGVLKRISNETNLGLTKSLNKGLSIIDTTYVARMDSDDYSAPDRFKLQIEYFDSHPDVFVLGGTIQEFNEETDCLSVRRYKQCNIKKAITKGMVVCHATVMMRMDLFKKYGLYYNEKYRTGQDSELWFRVIEKGLNIANLDDTLYYVYCDNQMMKRRSKKAFCEFEIFTHGIYKLYGVFTWRYIFPLGRLIMRLLPSGLTKSIYGSSIRKKIVG